MLYFFLMDFTSRRGTGAKIDDWFKTYTVQVILRNILYAKNDSDKF